MKLRSALPALAALALAVPAAAQDETAKMDRG